MIDEMPLIVYDFVIQSKLKGLFHGIPTLLESFCQNLIHVL